MVLVSGVLVLMFGVDGDVDVGDGVLGGGRGRDIIAIGTSVRRRVRGYRVRVEGIGSDICTSESRSFTAGYRRQRGFFVFHHRVGRLRRRIQLRTLTAEDAYDQVRIGRRRSKRETQPRITSHRPELEFDTLSFDPRLFLYSSSSGLRSAPRFAQPWPGLGTGIWRRQCIPGAQVARGCFPRDLLHAGSHPLRHEHESGDC
mmetsp:Transcript_34176/g.54779  ORF Transcript_34176/g.54779 Transcript_34176/m.54779 type:complete len:201 (-) Transcript_34176:23-625(-)